jgi:hypothetical protein
MPRPIKVLLVTAGNRFMEKALRSAANVELSLASQLSAGGKGYDLVVLDAVPPASVPLVNTLAFHVGLTNWFSSWQTVEAPPIVDWNQSHPIMRFVTFENVRVAETLGVKLPEWGRALVESPQTPLIFAGEKGRQRIVWVGFDSLESEWPRRVSFPIFIANAVEWLNPQQSDANQLSVQAGNTFRQPLFANYDSATITLPKGEKKTITLGPQAKEITWSETFKVGIYKVSYGTNELAFTVNMMDPAESDITPHKELAVGAGGKMAEAASLRANLEYWRWFVMAALAVLMFEWLYYHRRTA